MDKKILQERLDKLIAEKEQIRNTLIAYEGAIQECQYWLDKND